MARKSKYVLGFEMMIEVILKDKNVDKEILDKIKKDYPELYEKYYYGQLSLF